jgi:hypothetical protein
MRHIEEHILELYVLSSDKVSGQHEEIEAHLAECHGCRLLVEQMTASYRDVEERFKKLSERTDSSTLALTRNRTKLAPTNSSDRSPVAGFRPITRMQQRTYFVRRHPVIVGVSSFVAFAGLALLGTLMFKSPDLTDKNPAHIHYNPGSNEVEILNKLDQFLWKIPSQNISGAVGESESGAPRTIIADINGDGVNEVLTTLWTPEDALRGAHSLKVYDDKGEVMFPVRFEKQIKYLNRNYPSKWDADRVVVGDVDASGQKQILASWGCGRSPFVITRLDSKGNVAGEYWHFGVLSGMFLTDLNRDGRKELILTGANNALDSTHEEFPAIVVLDPGRIVGAAKSSGTPGFDLRTSDAEIYYVGLPVSPLSRALATNEHVERLVHESNEALVLRVANNFIGHPEYADLEYIFSRDFKVLQVKSTHWTDTMHKRLVQQGKLSGNLGAKYQDALKNGVRYWDGKEWRKEVSKVQHENLTVK